MKKFFIWNNARRVININSITNIKIREANGGKLFACISMLNDYIEIDQEEYQHLMNFIQENDK